MSTANSETTGTQNLDPDGRSANTTTSPTMDDMQLDPALVGVGQQRRSAEPERTTDRESYKAERRAQLVREAENMRDLLRQKEKELAELQ